MSEANPPPALPVKLELAPLPREQVGPFLLLGLEKSATPEQIEASWAKRILWARKKQIRVPLEDINWAREVVNDPERRVVADAASLNLDTVDRLLKQLDQKVEEGGPAKVCQPMDVEKSLADYTPPVEIPDEVEVRASIVVPEIPREFPVARALLEQLANEPLDPWKVDLPS